MPPLESATYISDLNTSNPVGSTDKVQTLDDHVRLIKSTLKTTFPAVTGAITATHTEINILDGVTLTAAQINDAARKSVANTFTVGQTQAAEDAAFVVDAGLNRRLGLAKVSGFAPEIRYLSSVDLAFRRVTTGTLESASASSIPLQLNADGSVTIAGVASTDFARLSQANSFTANQAITPASGLATLQIASTSSGDAVLLLDTLGVQNWSVGNQRSDGALVFSASSNLGTPKLAISASGNFDFKGGTVTTNDASAAEVGFKGAPTKATLSGSSNTSASNAGGAIHLTSSTGTFTLDSDLPTDSVLLIVNRSGSSWTIAASGTLTWAATGGTGSRTLADKGMCVALHIGSGNYYINGGGLS